MVRDPGRVATGTIEDMWMATGGRPAVVNTTMVGKTTVAIRQTLTIDNNMILCGTVKNKLVFLSVITLRLIRTKKTHTSAVEQGCLRGLQIIR